MNNVATVILRSMGCGPRTASWPKPTQLIRTAFCFSRSASTSVERRISATPLRSTFKFPKSCLSYTSKRGFSLSNHLRQLKKYDQEFEEGLTFRERNLDDVELRKIFFEGYPDPALANRLLKVLHARRVDGTLDIPLDFELSTLERDFPNVIEYGLEWLNSQYPIDTDAAILARFKREEAPRVQENPSFLLERGQRLGLFKPQEQTKYQNYSGPQSGQFYAELGEKKDDVYGKSVMEQVRAANEAKAEEEDRKFDEEVERRMAEAQAKVKEKSQALAERPEQGIEISDATIRPPNLYEKWVMRAHKEAASDLTLDSPEIKNMTFAQRVIPSLLLVLSACGLLYLITEYWHPPRRSERMFPDTSLAVATIGTLVAMNFTVFLAWRVPGAWKLLNRYFIVTPGYPRMFSMIGNCFSHQSFSHLFWNMITLVFFGPSLHEDVGRANFLAIYLASGFVGSWFSMTTWLARGILGTSHQGASGCVYGIVAAYFYQNRDKEMTLFIIPQEYQKWATVRGSSLLWALFLVEIIMSFRNRTADAVAHVVGMATGISVLDLIMQKKSGH